MRVVASWVLGLAVMASTAIAASAHSIKELETQLGDREQYFQPVDKPAPEITLRDADGKVARLSDLRGKVVVLHFIYAGCPDICPLHAERIADVQAKINHTPMKKLVQFISVTTDPSRDTPAVLRDYGPAHGLDPVNWTFLTTTPDQPEDTTRRLAEAFGHGFVKTSDEYQIHGIITHVIDKEGRWRANFHGLKFDPVNLVLFVNALVNDVNKPHGHRERGFWDKAKELF